MITFEPPYAIVLAFLFFVGAVFFGIGAVVGETINCDRSKGHDPSKWVLLIGPSLVGAISLLFLMNYLHQILQNPALN